MGACLTPSCDSIKCSRVAQFRYTAKVVFFLPERESLCIVAESPEVLKSKEARKFNRATFLNRLIGGLPFGLVEFSWDLREV